VKYEHLTETDRREIAQHQIGQLEAQHYARTLDLRRAEGSADIDTGQADQLKQQLSALERDIELTKQALNGAS
jgi:hypothetical protein